MPDIFHFISKYFWLIALGFAALNYAKAKRGLVAVAPSQAASLGHEHSEGEVLLKRLAIGFALPWAMMGVGQLSGSTPTVWNYFRPQDGNPFVIAWFALNFATSCLYAWWVLFGSGASKMRTFNLVGVFGQHTETPPSTFSIKAFALLGPLVITLWLCIAVTQNFPLSK